MCVCVCVCVCVCSVCACVTSMSPFISLHCGFIPGFIVCCPFKILLISVGAVYLEHTHGITVVCKCMLFCILFCHVTFASSSSCMLWKLSEDMVRLAVV